MVQGTQYINSLQAIENSLDWSSQDRDLMSKYSSEFKEVDAAWDRKCAFKNFKCGYCDHTFSTHVKAMCMHVEAHKNDEVIKIGVVKDSKNYNGALRPQHHWYNSHTGNYEMGGTCKLAKIYVPKSCRKVEVIKKGVAVTRVYCRHCDKFHVEVKEPDRPEEHLRSKVKTLGHLTKHEAKCRSK